MASVVDDLNELLCRERGEVEAVQALLHELSASDPDIADSGRDVLETASWSCQGLWHRINQLGGTATVDASDLGQRLDDLTDTKSKLELICKDQKKDRKLIDSLLKNEDLDKDTRSFLEDLHRAHCDSERWCERTLNEWKRDI